MTAPRRPNFVFIVADDLGYADLGCYGGRPAAFGAVSPVIDRLALRRGRWKYLQIDGHEYLFDIDADARERANRVRREPERLAAMRDDRLGWHAQMPPIPDDATVSLGYSSADMPQR